MFRRLPSRKKVLRGDRLTNFERSVAEGWELHQRIWLGVALARPQGVDVVIYRVRRRRKARSRTRRAMG